MSHRLGRHHRIQHPKAPVFVTDEPTEYDDRDDEEREVDRLFEIVTKPREAMSKEHVYYRYLEREKKANYRRRTVRGRE